MGQSHAVERDENDQWRVALSDLEEIMKLSAQCGPVSNDDSALFKNRLRVITAHLLHFEEDDESDDDDDAPAGDDDGDAPPEEAPAEKDGANAEEDIKTDDGDVVLCPETSD